MSKLKAIKTDELFVSSKLYQKLW